MYTTQRLNVQRILETKQKNKKTNKKWNKRINMRAPEPTSLPPFPHSQFFPVPSLSCNTRIHSPTVVRKLIDQFSAQKRTPFQHCRNFSLAQLIPRKKTPKLEPERPSGLKRKPS